MSDYWRHLCDFGRHFGPSWAPRGSQNRAFWYQDAPRCQKMRSRMRHQKKDEFLIEFRSEHVRFWRCWTHRNALYISISVVFADYDKIENFMKIDAQMDQKSSQNRRLGDQGSDFWGFWQCFEECDFWWFLRWAKIDQKRQKFDTWAAKTCFGWFLGAGRRQRRSSFARFYKF